MACGGDGTLAQVKATGGRAKTQRLGFAARSIHYSGQGPSQPVLHHDSFQSLWACRIFVKDDSKLLVPNTN